MIDPKRGYTVSIKAGEKRFYRRVALLPENMDKIDEKILYISRHKDLCLHLPSAVSVVICDEVRKDLLLDYNCNYLHIPAIKDAMALAELIFEIQSSLGDFEESVYNEVLNQSSLQACVTIISSYINNPCYIIDSSFKCLAIENAPELSQLSHTFKRLQEYGYMPINTVLNILTDPDWLADSKRQETSILDIPAFYCPFISYKIRERTSLQGYLFVVGILHPLSEGDLDVIDQIGPIIETLVRQSLDQTSIQGKYYEHFLKDVITGRIKDRKRIKEQLVPLSWQIDDTFYLVSCPIDPSSHSMIRMIIDHIEDEIGGKSIYYEDRLYSICCPDNIQDFKQDLKLFASIFSNYKLQAGVSIVFSGFDKIFDYASQPKIALDIGSRIQPDLPIYSYKNYTVQHMLILYAKNMGDHALFPNEYLMLRQYDEDHNTQYVETIHSYIENDRSLVKTAQTMNIHRNTLLHRLDKITDLAEINLDDPTQRQLLQLSWEMDQLIQKNLLRDMWE